MNDISVVLLERGIFFTASFLTGIFHYQIPLQKAFFIYNLASPRSALSYERGESLTNPTLITAFIYFWTEIHREPRKEGIYKYIQCKMAITCINND